MQENYVFIYKKHQVDIFFAKKIGHKKIRPCYVNNGVLLYL